MLKGIPCRACGKTVDTYQKYANVHNECRQLPSLKRSDFRIVEKPFQK